MSWLEPALKTSIELVASACAQRRLYLTTGAWPRRPIFRAA
jgi:hypothetical protein